MCKELPLSRGLVALVDASDYDWLMQWKWSCDGNGYACRMESYYVDGKRRRRKIMLHRFILNAPPSMEVDHKFHNKLDCRRSELRLVTQYQNRCNSRPNQKGSSRYKGVCLHKGNGRWSAEIHVNGRKLYLGLYACEEDAALAYDRNALRAWGDFAYLNFPALRQLHINSLNYSQQFRLPVAA